MCASNSFSLPVKTAATYIYYLSISKVVVFDHKFSDCAPRRRRWRFFHPRTQCRHYRIIRRTYVDVVFVCANCGIIIIMHYLSIAHSAERTQFGQLAGRQLINCLHKSASLLCAVRCYARCHLHSIQFRCRTLLRLVSKAQSIRAENAISAAAVAAASEAIRNHNVAATRAAAAICCRGRRLRATHILCSRACD